MKLSDKEFVDEALRIVESAKERGVVLRILGAIAVRLHCENFWSLHEGLNRLGSGKPSFTDIDLIGYSSQRKNIRILMERELGFQIPRQFLLLHGKERLMYIHPEKTYNVDIFLDKLCFSHDIYFKDKRGGRLELDYPTIPLSDLLLEKLQIHEINEKDIKDVLVLIRAHEVAESDEREVINVKRMALILGNDWGFWYDVQVNLNKSLNFARKYVESGLLSQEDFRDIAEKINNIVNYLNEAPKTKNWIKRARIGTSKKWWRDVEEISR